MTLAFRLDIPLETPSNNEIRGMHFKAYRDLRNRWAMEVLVALKGRRPAKPVGQAFVAVYRRSAGGGLDWDNAYGGLKPLLDCLVLQSARNPSGMGLIQDDSPKFMPYPPFVKQESAPRGAGSTSIEIYELPPVTPSSVPPAPSKPLPDLSK